jgi:hypothetical protein
VNRAAFVGTGSSRFTNRNRRDKKAVIKANTMATTIAHVGVRRSNR